jgi:UDP-N-acetylglucosamine/UDP-N-acetylgalactosamine diphosphorylase
MKRCGIEFLSCFQVDNALISILIRSSSACTFSTRPRCPQRRLLKTGPKEKVGNFCLIDGKVNVIEYSDLPDESAEKRNSSSAVLPSTSSTVPLSKN